MGPNFDPAQDPEDPGPLQLQGSNKVIPRSLALAPVNANTGAQVVNPPPVAPGSDAEPVAQPRIEGPDVAPGVDVNAPADAGPAPVIPVLPKSRPAGAPTVASAPNPLASASDTVTQAEAGHATAAGQTAESEADAAQAEAEERDRLAREAAEKEKLHALDRQEAEARIHDAREKASKAKFHEAFADKGALGEVARGLGILLGGISFDPGHQNQAVGIIDRAIQRDFEKQQAEHAELWRNVDRQIESGKELRTDQLQEMADFRTRQAMQLEAVIARGKAMASLSRNKEGVAAMEANNARLAFERDKAIDESTRLHQAAAEKRRVDTSEIALNYAKAAREKAVGSSEKTDEFQRKLTNDLNSQINREPGKLTARRLQNKTELEESLAAIDTGNAAAIGGALDKFVKSATGLGARKQMIDIFQRRLGSSWEVFKGHVQQWQNGGDITPKMAARLRSAVSDALDENTTGLQTLRKAREKGLAGNPVYKKNPEVVKSVLDTIYGIGDETGAAGGKWVMPKSGRFAGKQVRVDDGGNVLEVR